MFNFFESLKKEFNLSQDRKKNFNVVLMGNEFLYVEGHKGLLKLSEENVGLKVKGGVLVVLGEALALKELTQNTVAICGKIKTFEVL